MATEPVIAHVDTKALDPRGSRDDNKLGSSALAEQRSTNIPKEERSAPAEQRTTPNWEELIYEMKLTGLTKAVAQHCTITLWKPGKIGLTLDPMHKALLQQHHEQKLQDALQKHLGQPIQLKISLGQALGTPALKQQHKQAEAQQAAEVLVSNDKHVQDILTTFNAKLERVIVKDTIEN